MKRGTALIRFALALLLLAAVFNAPAAQATECIDGQWKFVILGPRCGCPDGMSTPRDYYQCFNGEWEFTASGCGGPFCNGGGDDGGTTGGGGTCCYWNTSCYVDSNGVYTCTPTTCASWGCFN